METIVTKFSSLIGSNPVDFPITRLNRRVSVGLYFFLLAFAFHKEADISCFTPTNTMRANASAYNEFCKASELYLNETPLINTDEKYVSFKIHRFPTLYHLLMLLILLTLGPYMWYESAARNIIGNAIDDVVKVIDDFARKDHDVEAKWNYECKGGRPSQMTCVELKGLGWTEEHCLRQNPAGSGRSMLLTDETVDGPTESQQQHQQGEQEKQQQQIQQQQIQPI